MKYFQELPRVAYPRIENDNTFQYQQLTNILTRSAFLQEIVENTGIFYDYEVKDGETPEIIAHKLYGSVERYWIVLLFNKLMNPLYDFPLTSDELDAYILSKYGYDATTAQSTHDHWERWVYRTVITNGSEGDAQLTTYEISAQQANESTGLAEDLPALPGVGERSSYDSTTDVIDATTSVYTDYQIFNVSVYRKEFVLNEQRRKIKLLDAKYAGRVEAEFKRLMRT